MTETRSTCPYCGVGCGVVIESDGSQISGVRGDPQHPANLGRLCSKGSTLHLSAAASITKQTRLLQPMRRAARGQVPQPIAWDAALDELADRLARAIAAKGPDAIGLYVSGQLLTEDYYVFNKLAKGLVGTNNIDTNSRLCMSSAVAGYKATLGADTPPCSYDDLAHAGTVFISGSNLAWAHPVLMRRLEDAKRADPQQKWIVVDPRRTETAAAADLHLQILPGTDVALCHGLAHLLLWEGHADRRFIDAHTSGFDALRDAVRNFTPAETARLCGIEEEALVQAARWFGAGPTLSLYCQGLNQSSSGTDKNAALINLHLLTGQIGRRGAGPFSLTGQPNAMGGREVGGMATLSSAHRDLANPQHRAEVAALWGIDSVPAAPGKSAVEMFEAAADGAIDALWIVCTNPAQSLPDAATVQRALERCPFVVVQEAYATTATARHADLLLPATTWGEKDGTVTNSERRISRVRPAIAAPGQARHDWRIAVDVAHRLEARLSPTRREGTLFPYDHPESIWNEHRESTRGRDLDITGLSYAILDHAGPQQWPYPAGATHGRARLYENGRFATPDGRARFAAPMARATAEKRDAHYPFALTTGRLRDQWHGMSRTGTLGRLFGHASEPVVELHPSELARLRLQPGELVRLKSRRGSLVLPATASDGVAPAQAFVAMHWGSEFVSGGVNRLTTAACCPHSRQPELKHAAVKVTKAELPWQLAARAWLPQEQALALRERVMTHASALPYAMCVPFGRGEGRDAGSIGLWLRAAAPDPPAPAWLSEVQALLGLDGADTLRYADARQAQHRCVRIERRGDDDQAPTRLHAFLLAGDTRAAGWMSELLTEHLPADAYGRALLAGSPKPPAALPPRGAQVCTCFDVTEPQIDAVLARCSGTPDAQLAQLQAQLRCGTNCGSCLPQLKRRVARQMAAA